MGYNLTNYPHLSRRQPFISVAIMGATLSKYAPTGDELTKLVVSRVGEEYETLVLSLLEQTTNKLTFAATEELLNKTAGRYKYKLYYKGNYLGSKQFILDKPTLELRSV